MIFGIDEKDSESLEEKVGKIFEVMEEKPRPENASRIGMKTTHDNHRPVIVKFRCATGILRKSQTLRNSERFKNVFMFELKRY